MASATTQRDLGFKGGNPNPVDKIKLLEYI